MTRSEMERLVQRQLEAYNRRDLQAFCDCFHPEVEVYREAGGPVTLQGLERFRESYRGRFDSSPQLHARIQTRLVLSETVLDEEFVTGVGGAAEPLHVVALYSFRDGLISRVCFAR